MERGLWSLFKWFNIKLVAPWKMNGLIVSLLWQIHPMPHLSDDCVIQYMDYNSTWLSTEKFYIYVKYNFNFAACINTTLHNYTAFVTSKPVIFKTTSISLALLLRQMKYPTRLLLTLTNCNNSKTTYAWTGLNFLKWNSHHAWAMMHDRGNCLKKTVKAI